MLVQNLFSTPVFLLLLLLTYLSMAVYLFRIGGKK
jgi:hypothetical protein